MYTPMNSGRGLLATTITLVLLLSACTRIEPADVREVTAVVEEEPTVEVAPTVLEPLLYAVHARSDANEFRLEVFIGADRTAELYTLVTAARKAAPDARVETTIGKNDDAAHLIDESDPDKHFFVTAGFYCGSGDPTIVVAHNELVLQLDDSVSCAEAYPVSSVFRIDRDVVASDFDVVKQSIWTQQRSSFAEVRNWTVVDSNVMPNVPE